MLRLILRAAAFLSVMAVAIPDAPAQPTSGAAQSRGTAQVQPGPQLPDWLRHIEALFQRNRQYPEESRRAREEGVVMVAFRVAADGQVSNLHLSRSSGFQRLDEEAVELVRRSSPLPVPPADLHQNARNLILPVRFSLRAAAPPQGGPSPSSHSDNPGHAGS
ncbi:energy transducer TonB [Rhodovarius crocodyli]|uniref:Energy transducer TonB n=1 Tax=Rhodovarius crocodyli TaxID=1979269 RepID=A0A437MP51_9PROT|nr:energy transducer TonB [Rhodovarius crocodyli]RVT99413.1 energy transducer TonB [Rhodovarius crocodyli]